MINDYNILYSQMRRLKRELKEYGYDFRAFISTSVEYPVAILVNENESENGNGNGNGNEILEISKLYYNKKWKLVYSCFSGVVGHLGNKVTGKGLYSFTTLHAITVPHIIKTAQEGIKAVAINPYARLHTGIEEYFHYHGIKFKEVE